MRTSMRDISKAFGVSIATDSRALKGDPNVKASTRERVVEAARQMGYEEEHREGRRKQTFRNTIAWLTNYPEPDGWRSVWSSVRIFNALQRLAAPRGY